MEEVEKQAKNEILKILNSPESISNEVINRELDLANENRLKIEKSLNSKLIGYFENINMSERLLKECERKRRETKVNIKDMDTLVKKFRWADHSQIKKLLSLRKNLRQSLDTLYDFLNISGQMKNLKEMMKDYKYYEHLHNKLLTISNLKESMREKVKTNPKLELTFKNFNAQFSESTTLQ